MSKIINPHEQDGDVAKVITNPMHRRSFFKYAGAGLALSSLVIAGCDNDDDGGAAKDMGVDLGSGDIGILNYAYALEQLEAAFYTQVIMTKYSGMSAAETTILTDIRDHEIAHREFFKAAIPAGSRIPALEVDFSTVNFNDRTSVLTTARVFEDLGVAAYNGAGKLLTNSANGLNYLLMAGKIVSVEARHAAVIHDLLRSGSRYGESVINEMGLDRAFMPEQVIMAADPYIKTKINISNLPK